MVMVIFLRFPNTRLGRLMSRKTIEDILELCEEFIPGQDYKNRILENWVNKETTA